MKYVTVPATITDSTAFESLSAFVGFNRCIGSLDGTFIRIHNCATWAANNHLGHKLNIPSRTYKLTVTHWQQIIGSTSGHLST